MQLDYEIEKYDVVMGEYVVWVCIFMLLYNVDIDIYIYYGNFFIFIDLFVIVIWNLNFKVVWYLNEDVVDDVVFGEIYNNLISVNNIGIQYGNVEIVGKIVDGQDFDGMDD